MKTIKLIIFDFDGVFTDGKFYFDNNELWQDKVFQKLYEQKKFKIFR